MMLLSKSLSSESRRSCDGSSATMERDSRYPPVACMEPKHSPGPTSSIRLQFPF